MQIKHMKPNLHVSNKDNNDSNNEQEVYDPRDNFGRSLRGLQSSALKTTIEAGDTIVCKRSIPNLGIYADLSYEVTSIYTQTFNDETQQIVKQQLSSLNNDDDDDTTTKEVYLTLYSPQFHSEGGPVVVTPEEVGLISIRDELGNAAWLALPGFFWIFVAASFFNTYHERTGGSFGDALLGRWKKWLYIKEEDEMQTREKNAEEENELLLKVKRMLRGKSKYSAWSHNYDNLKNKYDVL